jgi:hypothetical protein
MLTASRAVYLLMSAAALGGMIYLAFVRQS